MTLKLEHYEERLYETVDQISPCPYCGCDRIVVHCYNPGYENEDDYMVEHLDVREAVTAKCPTMYYAFESAEQAIEMYNMRKGRMKDDE